MELEHPIPQQISAYQFRLVGDMTLKQFFQVAGGALISLVIYSSSLASYIKWPLIIFFFLGGVAFAFFPLQDRPLGQWLILFIKAIYSPTLYAWKRKAVRTEYFQAEPTLAQVSITQPTSSVSTKEGTKEIQNLEKKEEEFLTKVSQHFQRPASLAPTQMGPSKPTEMLESYQIPKIEPKKIGPQQKEFVVAEQATAKMSSVGNQVIPFSGQIMPNVVSAQFSPEASPPIPPSKPNIVVGQVMDSQGKIIENAILEIRDADGRPARALKSNKLGHFMIVTPLSNGKYEIITEKEGLSFETVTIEAVGQIIPAIAIWAKKEGGKE